MTFKIRSRSKNILSTPHNFIPIIDVKLHSESPSRIQDTARTLGRKKVEKNLNGGLALQGLKDLDL